MMNSYKNYSDYCERLREFCKDNKVSIITVSQIPREGQLSDEEIRKKVLNRNPFGLVILDHLSLIKRTEP